jgi:ABC-type iron transport system FetAB permease component
MYILVIIIFFVIVYMAINVTRKSGIHPDIWADTVKSIFNVYVVAFVAEWFFPTLHRVLQLWCMPCGLMAFFKIAHTLTGTMKGTVNFCGFLYHFVLRSKYISITTEYRALDTELE